MGGGSCERLADATTKGVLGERDLLAVGAHDAGEHAVALPVVTPARAVGAESDAKLCFEPLLIDRGDNAAAQRHFLELLEDEVALAVVVVEELAVFGQPSPGIIAVVVPLTCHQQTVDHVPRIIYSFIQSEFAVLLHYAYFDTRFGTHLFYTFKNIVFFLS